MKPLSSLQKTTAALILLTIVFFGLFRLTESPPFGFDEGWAVQVATNISELGVDGLQFSPGHIEHVSVLTSVGYPLLYTLAFWFKLFGAGIFQARVMMALCMLVFAVVSFCLVRRLYGNMLALSSFAILATFAPFYSFGKNVIGEVLVLLFLTLFLLCFNLATNSPGRRRFWLMMAGTAAGLCIVTKTMAIAFVPVLAIGAVIALRRGQVTWKDTGLVALCAIIPIAVWITVNFQPGDTLASVANYYTNPAAVQDRGANLWRNVHILYATFTGLTTLALLGAWLIGVAVRVRARMKIPTEECIALIFACVVMLAFFRLYGDARYLFPIEALGILFVPHALYHIWLMLPVKFDEVRKNFVYIIGVIILCLIGLYQLSFNSYVADAYASHYGQDLSDYFSSIPATTTVFFYNATQVVPLFHGTDYYQRIRMFDKWVLGSDLDPIIPQGGVDMLVINSGLIHDDAEVSLAKYEKVDDLGQISVYKKKR